MSEPRPPSPRPARPPARRAPSTPQKIPPSVRFAGVGGYVPIVLFVIAAVVGVVMLRTHSIERMGAVALGSVVTVGLGWFAMSHRTNLKPGDHLRWSVVPLALVSMVLAVTPLVFGMFPSSQPVVLAKPGETVSVTAGSFAMSTWLEVRPTLVASAHEASVYTVRVTHNTSVEDVTSEVRPQVGAPPAPRGHALRASGSGAYAVQLVEPLSTTLALPLQAVFHTRPFTVTGLLTVFIALALASLAIDVGLRRRNIETSYASALWMPLASILYVLRVPMHESLPGAMAAAAALGFGAAIAAEILSRIVDSILPRPSRQ